MNERYGIDLAAPGVLEQRTGRWLQVRILGLLSVDSRLRSAVTPGGN